MALHPQRLLAGLAVGGFFLGMAMNELKNSSAEDKVTDPYKLFNVRHTNSGFDGLTLVFTDPVIISDLKKKLGEIGYLGTEKQLKKANFFCICKKNGHLTNDAFKLKLRYPGNTSVRVITKPLIYPNIFDFQNITNLIFGEERLANSRIVGLDCAINFSHNISEIVAGLQVKYKRKNTDYNVGGLEGLRFGSDHNVIVVYDHGKKHKTSLTETRIEKQISGKALPIKTFQDFLKINRQCGSGDFRPFKNISLRQIILNPQSCVQSIPMGIRYGGLQELLPLIGYSLTRKRLDRGRNFTRDYGKFLTTSTQVFPLEAVFTDIVNHFFQNTGDSYAPTN